MRRDFTAALIKIQYFSVFPHAMEEVRAGAGEGGEESVSLQRPAGPLDIYYIQLEETVITWPLRAEGVVLYSVCAVCSLEKDQQHRA